VSNWEIEEEEGKNSREKRWEMMEHEMLNY